MIAQWMGFEHLRGTARKHCRKCKCRSHSLLSKDNALVNTVVFNCRRFNQYPRSQAKSLWSHSVLVFSECHCLLFSEILYIFLESDNFPEIWYFLKIWCFLSFCKYSKIGEFFPTKSESSSKSRILQNLKLAKKKSWKSSGQVVCPWHFDNKSQEQAPTSTRGYSTTRLLNHYSYPTRKIFLLEQVVGSLESSPFVRIFFRYSVLLWTHVSHPFITTMFISLYHWIHELVFHVVLQGLCWTIAFLLVYMHRRQCKLSVLTISKIPRTLGGLASQYSGWQELFSYLHFSQSNLLFPSNVSFSFKISFATKKVFVGWANQAQFLATLLL